jgi:hypothetical protein
MPHRRFVWALLPVFALAACGGVQPQAAPPVVSSADAQVQTASLSPAAIDTPARLKGLTAIQVKSVLGSPNFRRRDNPAEIWQYRGSACTLDLFLYDEAGRQTVSHYAVRSQTGSIEDRDCFVQLTTAH